MVMRENYYTSGQQRRNDQSREHAVRAGQPWSSADSAYIQEHWVDVKPEDRDERAVAKHVGRTIEACRNHAEVLRGSRPKAGGGTKNKDSISRQISKRFVAKDDDDPLQQWYA